MKLKLKELNANPFKKEINKGKLSDEQINKIMTNLGDLGLMNSIPIVERDSKYYIVNGHHRVEALKRKYGKDFEIEVTVHKYNDDQLIKGMVIENLTQRGIEFREEMENVVLIEKYLNENNDILSTLRTERGVKLSGSYKKEEYKNKACSEDIAYWLNKKGKPVLFHDKITKYLNIYHNLSKNLQKEIIRLTKVHEEDRNNIVSYSQAAALSGIKDKEEQEKIFEKIKDVDKDVHSKVKLINEYKSSDEKTKQKVLSNEIDIAEIEEENYQHQLKGGGEDKSAKEFIPNFQERVRVFSNEVDKLEQQIALFRGVFYHKSFGHRYNSLGSKEKKFLDTSIYGIQNRIKKCYEEVDFFVDKLKEVKELEVKK